MGHRPPRGIAPPQLAGKRTGRPRGSRTYGKVWANAIWGYEHRYDDQGRPPNREAWLWWTFAYHFPDEVEEFLQNFGRI
jgi:hypothetical protein